MKSEKEHHEVQVPEVLLKVKTLLVWKIANPVRLKVFDCRLIAS